MSDTYQQKSGISHGSKGRSLGFKYVRVRRRILLGLVILLVSSLLALSFPSICSHALYFRNLLETLARMRSSLPAAQALVALGGLLGLVDAQGYFGIAPGQNDPQCSAYRFDLLGCFRFASATALNNIFRYSVVNYAVPYSSSLSYAFPGFFLGNRYADTVTPRDCALACRGHGYKYSGVFPGASAGVSQCRCATSLPANSLSTTGFCTERCGGDDDQFCNGATGTFDGKVTVDTSFLDDSIIPYAVDNYGFVDSYRPIGCFRMPDQFDITFDGRAGFTVATLSDCFAKCAGLGYPLVFGHPVTFPVPPSTTVQVYCQCSTEFVFQDNIGPTGDALGPPYRIFEDDPNFAKCTLNCNTGVQGCDSTLPGAAGRCCGSPGSDKFFPVYLNPELTGCYTPLVPGYKTGDSDRSFQCAPLPAELTGGPRLNQREVSPPSAAPLTDPVALERPLTVTAGTRDFAIYGCFTGSLIGNQNNLGAAGLLNDANTVTLPLPGPQSLDECAAACVQPTGEAPTGYTIFAFTGGPGGLAPRCVCSNLFHPTPGSRPGPVNMGACANECPANNGQACGGDGAALVYASGLGLNQRGVYETYLVNFATPYPTYACLPATRFVTQTSISVTVSTATTTVSGSVITTEITQTITDPASTSTVALATVTSPVTETLTVTTPFLATVTFVSGDATVTVTENQLSVYTTEIVVTAPGVVTTVTDTLIRGGVTETVTRANVTDTLIRGGVTETVTRTLTLGGDGGASPTNAPNAQGLDCDDNGCTLELAFGALRVPPEATANLANAANASCAIRTRSWYQGATTLLPIS